METPLPIINIETPLSLSLPVSPQIMFVLYAMHKKKAWQISRRMAPRLARRPWEPTWDIPARMVGAAPVGMLKLLVFSRFWCPGGATSGSFTLFCKRNLPKYIDYFFRLVKCYDVTILLDIYSLPMSSCLKCLFLTSCHSYQCVPVAICSQAINMWCYTSGAAKENYMTVQCPDLTSLEKMHSSSDLLKFPYIEWLLLKLRSIESARWMSQTQAVCVTQPAPGTVLRCHPNGTMLCHSFY